MTNIADNDPFETFEEQAAHWCLRVADHSLSAEEQAEFDTWLHQDPRHQKVFEDMVSVWQGVDAIAEMPGFLSLRAEALTAMEHARDRIVRRQGRRRQAWVRRIAALAAVLVLAVTSLIYLHGRPDIYETGVGERRIVQLDDGSMVSMDASSRIAVHFSDSRRMITLDRGRANFAVASDVLRPFTVTAGNRTVVATGTQFSVELLHTQMRVLLYEGHVSVVERGAAPGGEGTPPARPIAQLQPGQELVSSLSANRTLVQATATERTLAWQDGQLDFVDEPLASAVERINRYSNLPMVLGDAHVGQFQVSGVFNANDTRSFVTGITAVFPITARQEASRIVLISKQEGDTDK